MINSIYPLLTWTKNFFYDVGWKLGHRLPVPVISVGNLSFGGTGKTPFVRFLANELSQKKRMVVVCRSYKGSLKTPRMVDLGINNSPSLFGDEAVLLQKFLPNCFVWSGPSKWRTATASLESHPEIILLDDGFSHRQLQRQLDLVLIDSAFLYKPFWRREPWSALARAQLVVLTKSQLAKTKDKDDFTQNLVRQFPHLADGVFQTETTASIDLAASTRVFYFCGIANPDSFKITLKEFGLEVLHGIDFVDHQVYSLELQRHIYREFVKLKSIHVDLVLVTTEKDFVKIYEPDLLAVLHVVQYEVKLSLDQKEKLLGKIKDCLENAIHSNPK